MFQKKRINDSTSQVGDLTVVAKPRAAHARSAVASERRFIVEILYSVILFLSIFLFLWIGCPQYLLYHEQNQLFLFTGSYFAHAIAVPGGFADYISEFVVQFYYVPLYGALLTAALLTLSQVLLGLSCRRCVVPEVAYALAAIPPVLYLGAMGDENVLLSFAVAMMLTTMFLYLATLFKPDSAIVSMPILIVGFILLYWLAGPFALIYVVAVGMLIHKPVSAIVGVIVPWLIVWGIHRIWFEQYPLSSLMIGINYYRIPEVYPAILFIIIGSVAVFPLVTFFKKRVKGVISYAAAAVVVLFAIVYVPASFDKDKSRMLTYDSLVRQGRWTDIIDRAQKDKPTDIFSLQALNLALGMTGQLTETMFQYDQKGMEGLIGKDRLDNTTQLITAEALFRLGLTNIAFSTTFDLQEAIMNDRKSGRLMKRMAECMIINGNYDVAAKYIGFLRNSLYYDDWAHQAEKLLGNDSAVEAHPVYGPLRRSAFSKEAFYDYSQLDKILAMLALDNDGTNPLAWDYFCASAMLKGDLATLAGVYNYYSDRNGLQMMPRHVQEAIAMYWTFSHQNFDGLPFPINRDVQQKTAALAQAVMSNKNNPAAWKAAAPGSYGIYFLGNSYTGNQEKTSPEYQPTHE